MKSTTGVFATIYQAAGKTSSAKFTLAGFVGRHPVTVTECLSLAYVSSRGCRAAVTSPIVTKIPSSGRTTLVVPLRSSRVAANGSRSSCSGRCVLVASEPIGHIVAVLALRSE